ncbi:MAG TPA: hypothetical protein VNJ28_05320 [Candidatus Limnocylindrales bacterium]|nr:hypothetical protein [Candidatus Limnocylindrales bacterium]
MRGTELPWSLLQAFHAQARAPLRIGALALFVLGVAWSGYMNHWTPWDAYTYLAAGERLNSGHELYRLGEGDRQVNMNFNGPRVPLMYPPLVAVLWRPFAALGEWTVYAFMAITIVAVGWATVRLSTTVTGCLAIILLFLPIGMLAQVGNVGALIFAAAVLAKPVPLVVLAAIKPVAIPLAAWAARRDPRRALLAGGLCCALSLTAGLDAHIEYLRVAAATSGVGYALPFAPALLFAGTIAGAASYRVAIAATVFGSPVVTFATLGLLAPLAHHSHAHSAKPTESR